MRAKPFYLTARASTDGQGDSSIPPLTLLWGGGGGLKTTAKYTMSKLFIVWCVKSRFWTRDFSVYLNLGPGSDGIGKFASFLSLCQSLGVFTIVIKLQTVATYGWSGSTLYLFVHYHDYYKLEIIPIPLTLFFFIYCQIYGAFPNKCLNLYACVGQASVTKRRGIGPIRTEISL